MPAQTSMQLTGPQREALQRLLRHLIDQLNARVLIEPQAPKTGFWFGGGNLVQGDDGVLWLCGRYRNFGDSRTGLEAGARGLEIAIFRSDDNANSFHKVLSWTKPELSLGSTIVSYEGTSLHRRQDGVWELYISSEKDRPYPPALAQLQKPGTGVWSIDVLTGPSPDALDPATFTSVLVNDNVPQYLHVKDPVVYDARDGSTHMIFCSHPFSWSSSNSGLAVRPLGESNFHVVSWEIVTRGAAWDVAATRITARLPIPQVGLFADGPPIAVYFYDGAECLRSHEENLRAASRPRGYSCEEIGGAFGGVDGDFSTLERLSDLYPLFVSPFGTGASRYVEVLETEAGWQAIWEQGQSNGSQPLVTNFLARDTVEQILRGAVVRMNDRRRVVWRPEASVCVLLLAAIVALAACSPSPEINVITHLVAKRLGTFSPDPDLRTPGSLTGYVRHGGSPVEDAAVVVAERYGTPHVARTNADGRYHIAGIPPGQYVPAAVAVGYEEVAAHDRFGLPRLVTIESGMTTEAPEIALNRRASRPLPSPLAESVRLTETSTYTATAPFPSGSVAHVRSYGFEHEGVINDSLRVYLPLSAGPEDEYPILFVVYPGPTDNWQDISVALSSPGYAVVALAPAPDRGLDIDGHAMDARIALHLARDGALGPGIAATDAVAMGGSFSSPVLRRFLLDESENVAAWITLGGISDGYSLAHDFYTGAITVPEMHNLAIPSMGLPNLYPLPFLRYSTVYTAGELPPTLVIHTRSDEVTHIEQATMLVDALNEAGVPVEAYYYVDVSHYLQIGESMTEAGEEMYRRVLDFVAEYTSS